MCLPSRQGIVYGKLDNEPVVKTRVKMGQNMHVKVEGVDN